MSRTFSPFALLIMPMRAGLAGLSAALLAVSLSGCSTPSTSSQIAASSAFSSPAISPGPSTAASRPETGFGSIPGWQHDDLRAAWPAFMSSCAKLGTNDRWRRVCSLARQQKTLSDAAIRSFFEKHFVAVKASSPDESNAGLMTGYYEPVLRGARKRGGPYQTPLHAKPDDLLTVDLAALYPELRGARVRGRMVGGKIVPYPTRAELLAGKLLKGRELLWIDDPVDAFFMQVQGSGRVRIAETGETVRLAYADQNGHPYKSIGRYLVERQELPLEQASAQAIKAWLAKNPLRSSEVLNSNPSYIFFREERIADPAVGPKGALGVPLTPERSIAVDPVFIALGTPVFLSTQHPETGRPLQRLVIAQDTGSAITGPGRIDYFWGSGDKAGEAAGKTRHPVSVWLLQPKP